MTFKPSEQVPVARAQLETFVSALRDQELLRLVTIGRTLLDETRMMLAPSERALHACGELEAIVAAPPLDQRARFGALGLKLR